MPVRYSLDSRNRLVYTRVVLHRARAQRVHAKIDRIIPRRQARKVADDFDLADLGQVAEIFSFGRTKQLRRIYFRHVEWREFPGSLPCRRFLEDQSFVLVDVARSLTDEVLHRATSSTSSFAVRTERSLSANSPTAVSISLRVVI